MRRFLFLSAVLFCLACRAGAQGISTDSVQLLPPAPAAPTAIADAMPAPNASILPSWWPSFGGEKTPPVQGVHPEALVPWQVGVGYTFYRFYEYTGLIQSQSGFDVSGTYLARDLIGVDGELFSAYGSASGQTTQFLFGGAGPRVRYPLTRRMNLWAHALVGGARLAPATPYGGNTAFAYEGTAGIDIKSGYKMGYRVEGGMVETFFFGTHEVSPKIAGGLYFNF